MQQLLEKIKEHLVRGHLNAQSPYPPDLKGTEGVAELVAQALEQGVSADTVLQDALLAGMDTVGEKFKNGEYFVPEVLIAAKAMHTAMDLLRPLMVKGEQHDRGKVILGTVEGDKHDIGKNLVAIMLEGAGMKVIDLGIDVPPQKFIEAAREHPDAVVGMSALLTMTMEKMPVTIKALRDQGLNNKVIVGGAPVTEGFAEQAGADGYGADAATAVSLVKSLTAKN